MICMYEHVYACTSIHPLNYELRLLQMGICILFPYKSVYISVYTYNMVCSAYTCHMHIASMVSWCSHDLCIHEASVHIHTHTHTYIRMYVYMCPHIHTYMIDTNKQTHTHTHTHTIIHHSVCSSFPWKRHAYKNTTSLCTHLSFDRNLAPAFESNSRILFRHAQSRCVRDVYTHFYAVAFHPTRHLRVCTYVCMYVCMYTYVFMYVYIRMYTYVCMYAFRRCCFPSDSPPACIRPCMYVCMHFYALTFIPLATCAYTFMYVCIYAFMYAFLCSCFHPTRHLCVHVYSCMHACISMLLLFILLATCMYPVCMYARYVCMHMFTRLHAVSFHPICHFCVHVLTCMYVCMYVCDAQ